MQLQQANNSQQTLVSSEHLQAELIKERLTELFNLIQDRLIATDMGESQGMAATGLGMIQMLLMMTEAEKLNKLLVSCTEILRVVGKWDLSQESYQTQIEPLILPLLEAL